MHRPEINLFQHPTTTVYIDDSTAFLYSITLGVDHQPFRSFSEPFAGLDYVDQFSHLYELGSDSQSFPEPDKGFGKLGHNFSPLARHKLQNSVRFAEPSVVVIDYSMPELNGLDLCSRIQNPYIKKVLLTGVADEKIAIKALNTEIIDFYISKSEASLSQELYRVIAHLRDRYFQEIYGWTKDVRLREQVPYLYNSEFADFFEDVSEQLDIVEHYPIEQPWGFLLVSDKGKTFHLNIENLNQKQNFPLIDSQSAVQDIKPISIQDPIYSNQYLCSVSLYDNNYDLNKAKSFSHYLQGPGLSVITRSPNQGKQHHEH